MLPFQTHGKPIVLVPCKSQTAAIRFLNEVRSNEQGLGLFHGPPRSGKTSVIWQFTESLANDYPVAVIDGGRNDAATLLGEILGQFGFEHGLDTANERFAMLRVFAMQQAASGDAPLLIIENAHSMNPVVLEMICELAELTVNGKSALRIVLASHQPMAGILEAPAMEPVSSRVTGKFVLQPLTRDETGTYVHRKLVHGGCKNPQYLVPRDVCDHLHRVSGGWPGMIDRLAITAIAKAEKFPLRVDHVATTSASKSRAVKKSTAVPQLILTHRRVTLSRVSVNRSRLLIGRNELCDLRIDNEWISRHHAVLFRNGQATIVVDLKSRNGLYVNGRRVSKQVLVNDDIIALGDHRLKFVDPSARRRISLRGAGWDETTISKSIKDFRNVIKKQMQLREAS
jgi:type II secretory pathway predicted ATPase ExeA